MSVKLARINEVLEVTALKRSQMYRLIKLGKFPAPVKLSERCAAWEMAKVEDWISSKIAA